MSEIENKSKSISAQVANRMGNLKKKTEELDQQIQEEWETLKRVSAMGDFSENAERQTSLDSLALLKSTLATYMNILEAYETHDSDYRPNGTVQVGSTVKLKDSSVNGCLYIKLYPDDLAISRIGAIAKSSPIGFALIGKKAGDSITVRACKYEVEEVL